MPSAEEENSKKTDGIPRRDTARKKDGQLSRPPPTMLWIQMPFSIMMRPMTHLKIYVAQTMRYSGTISMSVHQVRPKATGTQMTHTKQLSNRKVMKVLPPERSVK